MSARFCPKWAEAVSTDVADRLASPADAVLLTGGDREWWPQSLAHGAAGVALLHIERARTGDGPWQRAHDWLAWMSREGATTAPNSHLHYGAPALAFAVHVAAHTAGGYRGALDQLDAVVDTVVGRRLVSARERLREGTLPVLAEFDAIRGLAGLGTYLLSRAPDGTLLRDVLACLVELTRPIHDQGEKVPGWWTAVGPSGSYSEHYPGGHANMGMAHGIAGPLALLAQAMRRSVTVAGQVEAIETICGWFDAWCQDHRGWPWWPYWITRDQLRGDQPVEGPGRPSWCYGTAGLVRAQHLAALALGDTSRAAWAEGVLAATLIDPEGVAGTVDASLCHGYAGLAHLTRRTAAEATTNMLSGLPELMLAALDTTEEPDQAAKRLITTGGIGLLEGASGTALALHTAYTADLPDLGWDSFLLIT